MSKAALAFIEETPGSGIRVSEDFLQGTSTGIGFDQLGGTEFVTESLLFSEDVEGIAIEDTVMAGDVLIEDQVITTDLKIKVDESAMDGSPVGIGGDIIGGFEFETESLLFQDFDPDTLIDIDGWYFELENEDGSILLESGDELLLERQA